MTLTALSALVILLLALKTCPKAPKSKLDFVTAAKLLFDCVVIKKFSLIENDEVLFGNVKVLKIMDLSQLIYQMSSLRG